MYNKIKTKGGETVGYEKLRYLMYLHNLTKADVIRATGITRPTLVNWERGRTMPRVKTLQILAEFFEVPVSYFLDE